jgi:hypothetical protein
MKYTLARVTGFVTEGLLEPVSLKFHHDKNCVT